jgi:hypothetical protein
MCGISCQPVCDDRLRGNQPDTYLQYNMMILSQQLVAAVYIPVCVIGWAAMRQHSRDESSSVRMMLCSGVF